MQLSSNNTYNLQSINKWVSDQTKDKIKRLLDDLSPDVQMVLLNAVYFHSKWKTPFKVKNTLKEEFYRPGLGPIKVPMMTSKKYPLASFTDRNLQVKVGQLQLSHDMSLVVIMPQNAVQNLLEVEKRLDVEVFKAVMGRLETTPLKPTVVCLPKFKVDSTQDLMAILGEMKYGVFFNTNLCGISEKEELEVSGARHRAVLELNEEGVEAAAATAISVARTAWFFEVQRPFLFVLWNNNAKFPVFMGRINDPTA
uniref:Serpin family G member 1 n=1 Tax=Sphenodon punctatus TaxID=8508 RepID=A0A8D0HH35_SPHPU